MIKGPHLILGILPAFWWLAGCGGAPAAADWQKPQPPARVANGGIKEADLATITLTRQAEERLGIETAEVEFKAVERTLTLAGEVVVPPGRTLTATAPIAGTAQAARISPCRPTDAREASRRRSEPRQPGRKF